MYNFGPINQITNNKLNKNKVNKDSHNNDIYELEKKINQKVPLSNYYQKINELEEKNNLQDIRINQMIANPGEPTEGNSELLDIRLSHDGELYDSAGDSIREQNNSIISISNLSKTYNFKYYKQIDFINGNYERKIGVRPTITGEWVEYIVNGITYDTVIIPVTYLYQFISSNHLGSRRTLYFLDKNLKMLNSTTLDPGMLTVTSTKIKYIGISAKQQGIDNFLFYESNYTDFPENTNNIIEKYVITINENTTVFSNIEDIKNYLNSLTNDFNSFKNLNCYDILKDNGTFKNINNSNGIDYIWNENYSECTISGTPTLNPCFYNLITSVSEFPSFLKQDSYIFNLNTKNNKTVVDLYYYTDRQTTFDGSIRITSGETLINFSSEWTGIIIRFTLLSTVGEEFEDVVSLKILNTKTNEELSKNFSSIEKKYISGKDASSYINENKEITLSDIREDGRYVIDTTWKVLDAPSDIRVTGLIVENFKDPGVGFIKQTIESILYPENYPQYCRFSNHNNTSWTDWAKINVINETTEVTYEITQNINKDTITNTYNINTTPNITTDSNGWLQAIDTDTSDESNKTDMTGAILSMLNETGYCHLSPGIFYVSGNIDMPNGSILEGCGKKTIIRLLSSVSSGYILKMTQKSTVQNICLSGGHASPTDIYATSNVNFGNRHGIYFVANADSSGIAMPSVIACMINNCFFENFDGSAVYCYNTGGGMQQSLLMENCYIEYCKVGINIDYYSEYHKFSNIIIWRCNHACINNGGNNVFVGCTFHGVVGWVIDNSNSDKSNNAHGSAIGCTFNHINNMNNPTDLGMGDAIIIKNVSNAYIFSGCQLWYGGIVIENSRGIAFSDCLIGGRTPKISVNGNYPAFFYDCIFHQNPQLTVNNSTKFINCYLDSDGSQIG